MEQGAQRGVCDNREGWDGSGGGGRRVSRGRGHVYVIMTDLC